MYVPDLEMCAGCGSDVPEWDMRRKRVGEGDTLQDQKRSLVCSLVKPVLSANFLESDTCRFTALTIWSVADS